MWPSLKTFWGWSALTQSDLPSRLCSQNEKWLGPAFPLPLPILGWSPKPVANTTPSIEICGLFFSSSPRPFILCKMHRGAHKHGSNLHMTTSYGVSHAAHHTMRPASPSGSVSRKMSFSPIMRTTIFGHASRICFKSSFYTHSVRFPPLPRNSILSTVSSLLFTRTQCVSPLFPETRSYPLSQPVWMSIGWGRG